MRTRSFGSIPCKVYIYLVKKKKKKRRSFVLSIITFKLYFYIVYTIFIFQIKDINFFFFFFWFRTKDLQIVWWNRKSLTRWAFFFFYFKNWSTQLIYPLETCFWSSSVFRVTQSIEGKEKRSPCFGRRLRNICLLHWMKRSIWCISCTRLLSKRPLIPRDSFRYGILTDSYCTEYPFTSIKTIPIVSRIENMFEVIRRRLYWNFFEPDLKHFC